jgi:hypothetical protein
MKTKFLLIMLILGLSVIRTRQEEGTAAKSELSPEDKIRKIKLVACVNLSKARITKDDVICLFLNKFYFLYYIVICG